MSGRLTDSIDSVERRRADDRRTNDRKRRGQVRLIRFISLTSLLNADLTKISKAEVTQPGYVASICIAEGEDDHDVFGNGGD